MQNNDIIYVMLPDLNNILHRSQGKVEVRALPVRNRKFMKKRGNASINIISVQFKPVQAWLSYLKPDESQLQVFTNMNVDCCLLNG